MADIRWVKLTTDMFDNRKIKHLRRLPEGNNIVLIWVMLLTMAGRCNAGGMIFLTENIPYTPKMLADELDFEENTVLLALQALEQLNMVVTNCGYFAIAGWEEYQNVEGMDKIREQNRIRQQRRREKAKQALIGNGKTCEYCGREGTTVDHIIPKSKGGADSPENTVCSCLSCNMKKTDRDLDVFLNDMLLTSVDFELCRILSNQKLMNHVAFDDNISCFVSRNVTQRVTQSHAAEEDIEEELELDKEKKVDCQQIVDLYHSICKSFPSVRSLSDSRRKAIKARLNTYSLEDFQTVFQNAESSSFMKGSNDRNWTATFDWLIKDSNMAKVLEGNYADKGRTVRKEKLPGWMMQPSMELGSAEMDAIRSVLQDDTDFQEEADQLHEELQESFGRK